MSFYKVMSSTRWILASLSVNSIRTFCRWLYMYGWLSCTPTQAGIATRIPLLLLGIVVDHVLIQVVRFHQVLLDKVAVKRILEPLVDIGLKAQALHCNL